MAGVIKHPCMARKQMLLRHDVAGCFINGVTPDLVVAVILPLLQREVLLLFIDMIAVRKRAVAAQLAAEVGCIGMYQ